MVTVTLADGTKLQNLGINGDNFTSSTPITEDIFEYNTSPVIINIDGNIEAHDYMELVQVMQFGNEWWFILRDLTDAELKQMDIDAKIDYIAMMADIDLEDFDV